jgi:hypothetical protein
MQGEMQRRIVVDQLSNAGIACAVSQHPFSEIRAVGIADAPGNAFTTCQTTQPSVLPLPQVKRLLADPVPAADLHHRVPRLCFPQHPQNRLFAVSSLRHLSVPLSSEENHDKAANSQLHNDLVFGFWSTYPVGVDLNHAG